MKKLFITFACIISVSAWAECELQYETPSDVADCYIKETNQIVSNKYNELLISTKKNIDPDFAKASIIVQQAQKAWLTYRDKYCESYSLVHGEINNYANCLIELNTKRIEQIQNDLDQTF